MTSEVPVQHAVADIAAEIGGTVGIAARNLAGGSAVTLNAHELFPLAACFQVPVMVELMRRVDAGAVRLHDRLSLSEADKSPGGILVHCHEGLKPTVRDLLYLMIGLGDGTATDMLHRLVGLGSVDETMRSLGLDSIAGFLPCREYFLMQMGAGDEWAGLSADETVASWREIEARGEREAARRRILEDTMRLGGADLLHLRARRRGRDESLGYGDAFVVDQALGSRGTPADMGELLAMIVENRCASAPSSRLMIEAMAHHDRREKISAGLADGLFVASKSGDVGGSSNDAAIVYTPTGVPLVMVVLWKGLGYEAKARARDAIASIARLLYEHLGEPA